MSIKISAAIVVTANGRMDVWQPGYLIVQDGQIVEAGPGHGPDGSFDETRAFPRGIVMPGWSTATRIRPRICSKACGRNCRWKSGANISAPAGANIRTKPSM